MNDPMGYTILDGEKWYREDQYDVLLERLDRQSETIILLQSKIEVVQRERNAKVAELTSIIQQLHTKNTCMCGGEIDKHGYDDGHSPVSMYDYALDNAEENLRRLQSNLETSHVAIETLQGKLAGALNRIEELEDRPAHCPTCDGDHL